MPNPTPKPHGLYTELGERISGWDGKIRMDMNTGAPVLDPPLRLARGEQVFAWFDGQLVGIFTDGGQQRIR